MRPLQRLGSAGPAVRGREEGPHRAMCLQDAGKPPWGWQAHLVSRVGGRLALGDQLPENPPPVHVTPRAADAGKGHADGPLPTAKQSQRGARGPGDDKAPGLRACEGAQGYPALRSVPPPPCLPPWNVCRAPALCQAAGSGQDDGGEGSAPISSPFPCAHATLHRRAHSSPGRRVPWCPFCR